MKLYSYFRSSAAFRVRIALALKGLSYDYVPVHLLKSEHLKPPYDSLLPGHLVPLLEDGDAQMGQSIAIIEYLEETHAQPALLPADAVGRARVRALSLDIACEIHPLNNLRVLRYLVHEMKLSEDDKNKWYRHWVETGLETVERQLAGSPATGRFCHGDAPTMADVLLVPQIFNAQRMECRTDHLPTVMRVFGECMKLEAFTTAQPSACPDATP
ncbi:MAG TPA: maleylacetoacetate isomerase [Rhizobacter sp.]|jgi:maleylacetoacetate isomerase/maleylpyruvate isomerase|nr:maleylacetoacetate isomerase [Rhizobacter sp.]